MQFDFSEDQKTFYQHVRDMLRKECTVDTVRAAWASETGRPDGLWATLAESGLLGFLASEEDGGLGMNELDFVRLLEATGEVALPEPIVEHAAVAVPLLSDCSNVGALPAQAEWLGKAIAGEVTLSTDLYGAGFVTAENSADAFIVAREGAIYLVPAAVMTRTAQESVDRTRKLATYTFDTDAATLLAEGSEAAALIEKAKLRGALASSAQLVGLAGAMTKLTVEYASVRKQFGKAIGTFQAVQHRIVNGHLKQQFAAPVLYRAAVALANDEPDAALRVSMAKVFASEAADRVSRESLQVHGGIGYTTEYELHLWMKRAWALMAAWGDARSHRRRVEALLLDA